ncbi:carboxylesterase/lipase family protein [Streptomyces laculatispora]|uniref:carboxylesterase/lipase family protein n=1 Tax=Streptomyces laculatispora TaxID=887464 RepID=UPI001A94F9BA|nr:carboxylesterase family protein [Streptomyces laculatispora]MBO0915116.1 carboxylesterase family protein [Streptomyces laculatispora]
MSVFDTACGQVRGSGPDRGVVAVLGIPYAEPPFGADRFRAPRPRSPWAGIRDCADFGPVPPQSAQLPGAPSWSPGDEDVLSLNVWTPAAADGAAPGGPLPVLVWIHGGAYTFGSGAQPDFDGAALARAGLVVVTLNYRLGFEGFGHVPADGADPCPPNRGLLDQIAALTWVRRNIAAFGGAPGNVTVAGQSSGAASVACLMAMDSARGLFRRAIAHSAVGPCYSPELAGHLMEKVAAEAAVPATSAGLAAASPQTLVKASDAVVDAYRQNPHSGRHHWDPVLYGPVADGVHLRADPLAVLAGGAASGIDLLVCHTTQEYWLLDAVGSSAKVTTEEHLNRFAADFGLPDSLTQGYRGLMPEAPVGDVHLALYGDLMFGEYSSRLADAHARAGGRTFLSRFARQRGGSEPVAYAWHCADVPFAFGNLGEESIRFLIGGAPTAADHHLSARMTAAWVGFAATGEPGWEPLGASGGPVRTWDAADTTRAPAPGHWSDSGTVRTLWRSFGYRPLRP